jgi:hypothetical protein
MSHIGSGMLSVPFYQVSVENRSIPRRMDKVIFDPDNNEEVTVVAVEKSAVVIYCDMSLILQDDEESMQAMALAGSVRSSQFSSRRLGEEPSQFRH